MLKLPSSHATSTIFYSRDPAFAVPVRRDETDDEWAKVNADWDRRVAIARETGVVSELCVEGATPTLFNVRPMPSDTFRKLADRAGSGQIGYGESAAIAFRACVLSVINLGDTKVKFTNHPDYGRIEDGALTQILDEINPSIVSELGGILIAKASNPGPK